MNDLNHMADLLQPGLRGQQDKLQEVMDFLGSIHENLRSRHKGWQPIKTAPKDRSILVTEETGMRVDQVRRANWSNSSTHNWLDNNHGYLPNDGVTHWMPLPEPPK